MPICQYIVLGVDRNVRGWIFIKRGTLHSVPVLLLKITYLNYAYRQRLLQKYSFYQPAIASKSGGL